MIRRGSWSDEMVDVYKNSISSQIMKAFFYLQDSPQKAFQSDSEDAGSLDLSDAKFH